MQVPGQSAFGAAWSATFGAIATGFTAVNTIGSAVNKTASALDHLAGWADKTAAQFEQEAQFSLDLRHEELMQKVAAHKAKTLAAPTAP